MPKFFGFRSFRYFHSLFFAGNRLRPVSSAGNLAVLLSLWGLAALGAGVPATDLRLAPEKPQAIYQPGERILWHLQALGTNATFAKAKYFFKQGGGTIINQGEALFENRSATIETRLLEPGTILAEVAATDTEGKIHTALAGAAVAPDKIPVSSPCPSDFDSFWQAKLAELATVPVHPVLTSEPSDKAAVAYWQLSMNNIRGTRIRGQLARPQAGRKFPALLIVQWAGVYPLKKNWATDRAAEGWLVLNIMAHDQPINEPAAFYEKLSQGALTNYTALGNDDREQSYFLRMYLSCYRAVEYLAARADWNGRTLIVSGTSQGGLQSLVTAGLNSKVTGLMALVPAGCDDSGDLMGRKPGWPYWIANAGGHDLKKVRETALYFDGVNFAARIHCPALVGLGLIDTTSPPSGVFAAINQIKGPREVIVLPEANHHGDNKTHTAFLKRESAWREALLKGDPVPLLPKGKGGA